jgi:formate dehydrogenase
MVALDFYVTETSRHADYILPATTFVEREDVPVALMGFFSTPFMQVTPAVVTPRGAARQEWRIIDDLSRRIGVAPYSLRPLRRLARLGIRVSPRRLIDALLRTGPAGDWFGLRRSGLSLEKVARSPHGVVLSDQIATDVLADRLRHRDKRVHVGDPEALTEIDRMESSNSASPGFPLRLIGLRELRSHNSWMHNAPLLMRGGRRQSLRLHPDDAEAAGLGDGDVARLSSESGSVEVPVTVTEEMTPGTVALPHGWGHRGGWRLANQAGGVNVNQLASSDPASLERLAGMAHLNGIPVRVEAAAAPAGSDAEAERPAVPA